MAPSDNTTIDIKLMLADILTLMSKIKRYTAIGNLPEYYLKIFKTFSES